MAVNRKVIVFKSIEHDVVRNRPGAVADRERNVGAFVVIVVAGIERQRASSEGRVVPDGQLPVVQTDSAREGIRRVQHRVAEYVKAPGAGALIGNHAVQGHPRIAIVALTLKVA